MAQRLDHIDLRVRDLAAARPFYARLLPALGFIRPVPIEGWFQLESEDGSEFFGIQEDPQYRANTTRIAFRAINVAEVDHLARLLVEIGAANIEGPLFEAPGYYAVFFEDPSGNRLEIVHRTAP
jgi:catechol 2,3-dioxygenase-like lactoylglutathione lyase family enzyme